MILTRFFLSTTNLVFTPAIYSIFDVGRSIFLCDLVVDNYLGDPPFVALKFILNGNLVLKDDGKISGVEACIVV